MLGTPAPSTHDDPDKSNVENGMKILAGGEGEGVENFEIELNEEEPAFLQSSETDPMHTYCSGGTPRLFSNNASYSYPRFLRIYSIAC